MKNVVNETDDADDDTLIRSHFFQTIQAWPLSEDLNYKGWLQNFSDGEEKKIARLILDFFVFYSHRMVNQMLKESVSKAGHIFSKHFPNWKHDHFTETCIYSFIPGEVPNPTDSGYLFTRKLRDELRIPDSQIINYLDIPAILKNKNTPTPILFVDDFVGTGIQVNIAWNETKIDGTNTLSQIICDNNHCAVYSPLIVNKIGQKLILDECTGLHLCATHIIDDEYNLFKRECICWKGNEESYQKGIKLITEKSLQQGIRDTLGLKTTDLKGFREQGLAIAFEHGIPDAVPPFFYWDTDTWTPLIRKTYKKV